MFDDIQKEPEDIFAESDKAAPQVAPPTDVPAATQVEPQPKVGLEERIADRPVKSGGGRLKVLVLIIGILVVVGAAFYLSFRILSSRTPVTPAPPEVLQQDAERTQVKVEVEDKQEEKAVVEEETVLDETARSTTDTDKDGLTDEEEKEIGTSARVVDTDGDGLFDFEEVKTWETNPINPDTDADGYLDGEEVNAGYNPNGGGKLIETPSKSD